jgi:hypothetical protein
LPSFLSDLRVAWNVAAALSLAGTVTGSGCMQWRAMLRNLRAIFCFWANRIGDTIKEHRRFVSFAQVALVNIIY